LAIAATPYSIETTSGTGEVATTDHLSEDDMQTVQPCLWFDTQAEEAAAFNGEEFLALNGGPTFTFSPAVSFVVHCQTQAEVDHYWESLGAGGEEGQCGWLTDKYGVSWQIVPDAMLEMLGAPDRAAAQRAFTAMLTMTKLDITQLQDAFGGS
jgi:predicted 3-demethylubiquinone-9 3-methyltransferase (glyoxalase superfamily)